MAQSEERLLEHVHRSRSGIVVVVGDVPSEVVTIGGVQHVGYRTAVARRLRTIVREAVAGAVPDATVRIAYSPEPEAT